MVIRGDMDNILYSHRLKSSLQQLVCVNGMSLSLDDASAPVSLSDNEPMLRETASGLGLNIHIEHHATGTTVTFYR